MRYANREWMYDYRRLWDLCSEQRLAVRCNQIAQQFAPLTKAWSIERNSEWTCRTYLSSKMILNATALWNSLEFAQEVGLRAANSYFAYYSVLSLLRGVVFMLPNAREGDLPGLMAMSHTATINLAYDWLAHIDQGAAKRLKHATQRLKAERELIAYKAPASADLNIEFVPNLLEILIPLAELAQFTSEILEASLAKHATSASFQVLEKHILSIAVVDIDGFVFEDRDDLVRLDYVRRKICRPYEISSFMHKGLVEDFFGSWDGDEEKGEQFTNGGPSNWIAIFDVP